MVIKLKKILKESKYAWDRKFGDPLPTFKDIAETHQNKPKETIKEASMPGFGTPTDVSYYYNTWGEIFAQLSRFNDYGPRESDMYDWNSRANYQATTKEYHAHMKKVAKKFNSAVGELENAHKAWNKILKKHRKNDGS